MSLAPEDDAAAAEYALGISSSDERQAAAKRVETDPAFATAVREWEVLLAPLAEAAPDQIPAPSLRGRVLQRIADSSVVEFPTVVSSLRGQIQRWRIATGLVGALAACLSLWIARTELSSRQPEPRQLLAVLQQGAGPPAFIVSLDLARRQMTVVPSAEMQAEGRSYELWMIGADQGKPVSLGLLNGRSPVRASLPSTDPRLISQATYAVTLEPPGDPPTGNPPRSLCSLDGCGPTSPEPQQAES